LDNGAFEYHLPALGGQQPTAKVFIRNGSYSPIVQVEFPVDGLPTYEYCVQDHLGSPVVVLQGETAEATRRRFSPWGHLVGATGAGKQLDGKDETNKGYTGHMLLAAFDWIHMNGRVYDPVSSQFLSPDRYSSDVPGTMHLNRYSYLANSPLNGTDPSGWVIDWYAGSAILQPRVDYLHAKVMDGVADSQELRRSYLKLAADKDIYLKIQIIQNDAATHFSRDTVKKPRPLGEPWQSSLNPEVYHGNLEFNLNKVVKAGTGELVAPQVLFAHHLRSIEQSFYLGSATLADEVFDMPRPVMSNRRVLIGNLDHDNELVQRNTTVNELVELTKLQHSSIVEQRMRAITARELLRNEAVNFERKVAQQLGTPETKIRKYYNDTEHVNLLRVSEKWFKPF